VDTFGGICASPKLCARISAKMFFLAHMNDFVMKRFGCFRIVTANI